MKRYNYTLVARTPLSAGIAEERSNVRRAHTVVPGATLRGALAAAWWKGTSPGTRIDFAQLFDQELSVGQAVPADFELVSASARVCKYRQLSGCAAVLQERGLPGRATVWNTCWECGGPLTPAAGWRRTPGSRSSALLARTRGALTDRDQAADGQLFTRQAVVGAKGATTTTFDGTLRAPEKWASWINHLQVRIGGGRSLDYGRAELVIREEPWPVLPGAGPFALRLKSPAILLDEFGGPDVSLEGWQSDVRRVTGEDVTLSAEPAWLRTESVSGWHMRSRLPKVHDWALAPGSVAVAEGLSTAGWQRLAQGIGFRTLEGYGQVEIIDPASVSAEPANEGHAALARLRSKIAQPMRWVALKRELLTTLKKMLDADPPQLELLPQAPFPNLLGEERTYARAVLTIPRGHVPGTIDKLEGIK